MREYALELYSHDSENNTILTIITSVEDGITTEEVWSLDEDNRWIWQNGYGDGYPELNLYDILQQNDKITDSMLHNLCKVGNITLTI